MTRSRDRLLGMDREITRRDFLGATLLGTGAFLLGAPPPAEILRRIGRAGQEAGGQEVVPDWGSYGGVGDYAESYGNTEEVVRAAHAVRTGRYLELPEDAHHTGEMYDLVVVGAGFSGLSAAFEFQRNAPGGRRCLILDNHPIFGGEAKRNEFVVNGLRLIGPQGSNGTLGPEGRPAGDPIREMHAALGIPESFDFREWDEERFKPLEFAKDNYSFLLWGDRSDFNGYFFDRDSHGVSPRWVRNIWDGGMDEAPWPEEVRRDLLAWRSSKARPYAGADFERWLDTMTYQEYVERLGHGPAVLEFTHPILASGLGLGGDVLSAYRAYASGTPGFDGFTPNRYNYGMDEMPWFSFPGGNTALARYFVKALLPEAIRGTHELGDVITGRVNFRALDRPGARIRMRLRSTVVHVRHEGPADSSGHVVVAYTRDGEVHLVRARSVALASGSWINRHIVVDAPERLQEAWAHLVHAPMLSINVALTNWRFLYELGVTACRWFSGFGFAANIRRPMLVGDYRPPLDPDRPIVLTLYIPFDQAGLPAAEQGSRGRQELLFTTYAAYERRLREQLLHLFAPAGFDPRQDIAGIVVNRWGHAYVVATPGFHFGTPGNPTPAEVIREGHGRIRFGHSELLGHQHWPGAVAEGQRAAREALEVAA